MSHCYGRGNFHIFDYVSMGHHSANGDVTHILDMRSSLPARHECPPRHAVLFLQRIGSETLECYVCIYSTCLSFCFVFLLPPPLCLFLSILLLLSLSLLRLFLTVMTIVWQINDGARAKMYQCCWNFPGNDVSGMVASSEKYAGTCEKVRVGIVASLLDDPAKCHADGFVWWWRWLLYAIRNVRGCREKWRFY